MATFLGLLLLAAATSEPGAAGSTPLARGDFAAVIDRHVAQTLGRGVLPTGHGNPIVPGLFVTVGRERVDIFDRQAFSSEAVADPGRSGPCRSGCPAAFFEAFQWEWLRLAGESAMIGVEIPTTVHFTVDRSSSAQRFVAVAYAAAESRPVVPPNLSLVVEADGRGLQSQPFFLVPPAGLGLQRGAAVLGLTLTVDADGFEIRALDTSVGPTRVTSLDEVRSILAQVKKANPGKNAVILVAGNSSTVEQLAGAIQIARSSFERIVLASQPPSL